MMSERSYNRWQKIFLFCLGLFIASAFCMKWMEPDLVYQGKTFTVIGLEITYPKEKIMEIFSGLEPSVKKILRYHLSFDFMFMPGVFLGILSLCKMASFKTASRGLRKTLSVLVFLQILAWGLDISENCFLLSWLNSPVIGNEFKAFHIIVISKWIIALAGLVISIPIVLKSNQLKKKSFQDIP